MISETDISLHFFSIHLFIQSLQWLQQQHYRPEQYKCLILGELAL